MVVSRDFEIPTEIWQPKKSAHTPPHTIVSYAISCGPLIHSVKQTAYAKAGSKRRV